VRRWLRRMCAVLLVYAVGDALDTYTYLYWGAGSGDWFDLGYSLPFAAAAIAAATWETTLEPEGAGPTPLVPVALWTQFFPVLAPIAGVLMAAHMVTRLPRLALGILGVSMACFSLRLALTQHREHGTLAMLKASEARYRDLIENANDIILTLDAGGKLTTLNRLGEVLTGTGAGPDSLSRSPTCSPPKTCRARGRRFATPWPGRPWRPSK